MPRPIERLAERHVRLDLVCRATAAAKKLREPLKHGDPLELRECENKSRTESAFLAAASTRIDGLPE